ncbi:hypothetical protein [Rummeliibacillus stabekisii]|uniref:hypothetical protein n=1 Tax=Rummeliibacillus stabekisii TaxID=241244 RepID=UPI003715D1A0
MLFITKKSLESLAESHREPDMLLCYATPQGFSAITNRAILLINDNHMIVLFLNLFSTKIVHKLIFELAEIQDQKYATKDPLTVLWSFNLKRQAWKFRIPTKILTLGSMQREFLMFVKQNIL